MGVSTLIRLGFDVPGILAETYVPMYDVRDFGGTHMRPVLGAAAAALLLPVPALAQTYYARQPIKQVKSAASATLPTVPKTLTCGGLTMGRTTYPEQNVQGPIRSASSFADGMAACDEIGAKHGEVFKAYGFCKVAKVNDTLYYPYLVIGSPYDYPKNDAYAQSVIGTGSCTYNP